jgi:hypothetical protein
MSHINRRDPSTHRWAPLRTPPDGQAHHRERLEALARVRNDDVVVTEEANPSADHPGSWALAAVCAFWILVAVSVACCCA